MKSLGYGFNQVFGYTCLTLPTMQFDGIYLLQET